MVVRKRRCFCPRRNVLVIFVTTAFVRRRNTRPRSLIFLLVGSLAFFPVDDDDDAEVDAGADVVDDDDAFSGDFRRSLFLLDLFNLSAGAVTLNDERVRRTAELAVSALRRFLKAKFVPTELMVVLLVDTTLKPRAFVLVIFCLSRIFVRFGNNILFLLVGFCVKFGKIWRAARFAGKLASIR